MSFTTFFGSELPAGAFGAALISWDFLVDRLCLLPLAATSPSSSDSSFADPKALGPHQDYCLEVQPVTPSPEF